MFQGKVISAMSTLLVPQHISLSSVMPVEHLETPVASSLSLLKKEACLLTYLPVLLLTILTWTLHQPLQLFCNINLYVHRNSPRLHNSPQKYAGSMYDVCLKHRPTLPTSTWCKFEEINYHHQMLHALPFCECIMEVSTLISWLYLWVVSPCNCSIQNTKYFYAVNRL